MGHDREPFSFLSHARARVVTGHSWLGPPGSDPRDTVMSLLTRARSLRQEYDEALRTFIRLGHWAEIIDAFADLDGLPQDILGEWERTAQYGGFVARFGSLFDECSNSLSPLVGSRGSPVATRLRSVAEAVQLETKLRRLIQCLESTSTENLRFRTERRAQRRARKRSRAPQEPPGVHEGFAYGVLGVMIAVVALSLTAAIATLGVSVGFEVGGVFGVACVVVLWATRRWWVTGLEQAFSKRQR